MSKKYQILKCLDDYGTANITDLFARVDTGQTQAQLRTYLSVMQTNDGTVKYNPETMRFSLTDEGEKYLVNPPTIGRKKSAAPPIEDHPAPKTNPTQTEPDCPIMRESAEPSSDAIPDDSAKPETHAAPIYSDPAQELQDAIDKINNEFGAPGTDLQPVAGENPIDHPPHYTGHPSGVECIQITEHMNFNLGNAIKYIWRSALKGRQKQDLEKARWYINREIERLEAAK